MKKYGTPFHIARVVAAVILLQTLYFKFTAHPESVTLFTQIGMEPWGRIGSGIVELIAGLLLLSGRKKYVWLGASIAFVVMIGAVYFHLTVLGIDQLFRMAILVMLCSAYILWTEREST